MDGLGKYIRHTIAALMAAIVGYITAALATQGIEVPGDIAVGFGTFLTFVVYAFVEKFLKRFPWLDLEGYAEYLDAKDGADTIRARAVR